MPWRWKGYGAPVYAGAAPRKGTPATRLPRPALSIKKALVNTYTLSAKLAKLGAWCALSFMLGMTYTAWIVERALSV